MPKTIPFQEAPDQPMSKFTVPDTGLTGVTTTGTQTLAGTYNVSGVIDMNTGGGTFKRRILPSSGNTTLTAAMSGSVMLFDGGSVSYALPAIAAAEIGTEFMFCTTVLAVAQVITAQAADLLTGGSIIMSTSAGLENDAFSPDVTDDLIATMNGTTQGGIIGSHWRYWAISATRWFAHGTLIGSGTLVTNFS